MSTQPSSRTPRWDVIDGAYQDLLQAVPADRRWLLLQTLATAGSRRALQSSLVVPAGARIADIGCGYGASSLELAALRPATVVGIDLDEELLDVARSAASLVEGRDVLPTGSQVRFIPGDAYELPLDDESQDMVFCRFVFQHLDQPGSAAAEIERVLRPGGMACVVDVDDGLSISEPPPSATFERLAEALRASQAGYGGDRHIGRRLASLLDANDLTPATVLILPQAAYQRPQPGDPARQLLVERLRAARDRIVAGGHMTDEQFDADLAEFAAEEPGPTCEIEAHLAVVAVKPAS